ncbi:shikimate kinase [Comamonas odontotermitis]|uniref:Shikimate kinase n=1 Tax=Comamonas odontotermitis TaxID=379895 RepID=A0ABR6REN3_9BURK|nr:shikimate kinase [Comamonas odontotermitis]MBB6577479.1 shikimate kinase [Comamonas odontotermitis]
MVPSVCFIGLPGSGKSTIGRQLARNWGVEFVDSDLVLERRLGCSIKDYFAAHGEQAFRDAEAEVLADLARGQSACVLSTGGGAVLRAENRAVLHANTTVFYLQSSPEDIARRLRNDTSRPLLQGEDPLKRLRDLLVVRAPLYEETAHFVIDTVRCSTAQVVRKVTMQAELAGVVPMAGAAPQS